MLTPKREKFCQEIVKGKNHSDAYRIAFKPKKSAKKTINEHASRLMADSKVKARIAELMAPLVEEVQLTRAQWIQDGLKLYKGDIRKLYDSFGNPIPICQLADEEAAMIEGFKHKEDFLGVKKESGGEQAVASGFTDDYKVTSFKVRHEYVGKALGFYTEKTKVELGASLEELVMASMKEKT